MGTLRHKEIVAVVCALVIFVGTQIKAEEDEGFLQTLPVVSNLLGGEDQTTTEGERPGSMMTPEAVKKMADDIQLKMDAVQDIDLVSEGDRGRTHRLTMIRGRMLTLHNHFMREYEGYLALDEAKPVAALSKMKYELERKLDRVGKNFLETYDRFQKVMNGETVHGYGHKATIHGHYKFGHHHGHHGTHKHHKRSLFGFRLF